tara:strand:- start:452 stop:775 length:324 start_codon:yes stop_codon:yes gene_type:complete
MNIEELKKLLETSTEENIKFDEPHVSLRCEENSITKEKIIQMLLYESHKLTYFIEDRPKVYKLYFKLNKRRQLKVIIDTFQFREIMVRTIKILDRKLYKKLRFIRRR